MLAVSKLWSQALPSEVAPAPKESRPVRPSRVQPDLSWDDPHSLVLQKPNFRRFFGAALADDVQSWISCIRDPGQPIRLVSFLQLYISFQRHRGPWMILKEQGRWVAEKSTLGGAGEPCAQLACQVFPPDVSTISP